MQLQLLPLSKWLQGRNLLAWCLGILLAVFPVFPPLTGLAGGLLVVLFAALLLLAMSCPRYCLLWLICALAGYLHASYLASQAAADLLPAALDDQTFSVTGQISGLPKAISSFGRSGEQFELQVRQIACVDKLPGCERLSLKQLRLRWYGNLRVHAGEYWRFTVQLRRPRGLANPAARDYEVWLVQQGISATGKVIDGQRIAPADNVSAARQRISDYLRQALAGFAQRGILEALVNGNNAAIDPALWQLFADTNTTHLFVISGLHLTLMGGLCWWLLRRVLALLIRSPLHAAIIAAVFSWLFAACYALLAGWAIPVQRALLLFSVLLLMLLSRRAVQPLHSSLLLLALMLAINPLALLSLSFWLSWSAACVLLLALSGRRKVSVSRMWWRSQWAITLGLAPLLIFATGQVSLLGFVANLLAIPLVNLLVVPLDLLALAIQPFAAPLAAQLWFGLNEILTALLAFLRWLVARGDWLIWHPAYNNISLALLVVAVAWQLLPRAMPGRRIAWLCCLPLLSPLFTSTAMRLPDDELQLMVFDVGQGLAVLVRVGDKVLLYDTGPRLGDSSDAAQVAILPFLYQQGIRRLDYLVVSHADSDHAGGLPSLRDAIAGDNLLGGEPLADLPVVSCHEHPGWQWQQFRFSFMVVDGHTDSAANNRSCILRIATLQHGTEHGLVLLPGDIERAIEYRLLRRHREALRNNVLLVPHHGSRSSSTSAFIAAVQPQLAIVSSGYRHRFGHPHAEILQRYAEHGVTVMNTADSGAISLRWREGQWQPAVQQRRQWRYFWQY